MKLDFISPKAAALIGYHRQRAKRLEKANRQLLRILKRAKKQLEASESPFYAGCKTIVAGIKAAESNQLGYSKKSKKA